MRVLMLAQFYPPDIGGEERHARNLARHALLARGHEVEVLTSALASTGAGDSDEDGIVVHRIESSAQRIAGLHSDPNRPHALPLPDPATRRAIGRLLAGGRFDVVHAHNWIVNSALGPARETETPVVLTLHDYSHVCAVKRYMRDGHECEGPAPQRCLRCAGAHYGPLVGGATAVANGAMNRLRQRGVASFIAVSRAVADRNGLGHSNLDHQVIPNFVPDDLLIEEAPRTSEGPLLYLGDLIYDKGVPTLLAAYGLLSDVPELLLVGRDSTGLGGGEVPSGAHVVPPVSHERAVELMRSCRALVVPSIVADSCPTVVLEAMAAGKPVIGSNRGGIVDLIVDGETGLIVEPEEASLAKAMAELCGSPESAIAMGRAGLARAEMFTASAVAGRIEAVYRRVAA